MLISVEGTNPELKSVLLNSHYDVVPVFPVSYLLWCSMHNDFVNYV